MQNLLVQAVPIQQNGVLFGAFGHTPLALVDARDVADVLTTAGHSGMTYVITGPEAITYQEIAQTLSRVLGRPVEYRDQPFEAYQARLSQLGLLAWITSDLTALAALFRSGGNAMQVSPTTERFLGRPGRSFADFARDFASAFQPVPPSAA